jgi:hypothetical protein
MARSLGGARLTRLLWGRRRPFWETEVAAVVRKFYRMVRRLQAVVSPYSVRPTEYFKCE